LDKETEACRRLKNMELHDLHSSPDIIGVIKPRGMRWVEYAAHTVEGRCACRVLVGKPERKRSL